MNYETKVLSSGAIGRRGVLGGLLLGLLWRGRGAAGLLGGAEPGPAKPEVVRVTGPGLFAGAKPSEAGIGKALAASLDRLVGGGWERLFSPGDRVALKLNCLAGRGLSPDPALVAAIIAGLKHAGVNENDIQLFDRVGRDLERAGFTLNTGAGVKCYGHDMLGEGYEREPTILGSLGSCFSTVLTRHCDKLINVGVLKDHDLAGVSIGMKNLYGLIHNPSKYHQNSCSPYVAELASHPDIRRKMVLTICDGLVGQYHGGPGYKPAYCWPARTLLVSRDPVALDRVGLEMIELRRREAGLKNLAAEKRYPAWLEEAARLGLGEAKLDKIRISEVAV